MKFQFKISDEKKLKRLQENWLTFLYKFFEEKITFQSSQTEFLAILNPHTMKSCEHSRVLLFAYNKGETLKVLESSIAVGLLQGTFISRIKHAPPFTIAVQPGESACVEFPLKGDNTPKGKYKINIIVKESGKIKQLAEKFSICSLSDFISEWTGTGIPGRVLTGWALKKLKNRTIHISRTDALYLGTAPGAQYLGRKVGEGMKSISGNAAHENVGTAFSGIADGALNEMFDTSSPSLTLTVV